jgi:thiol:disulfide interchange protein DsbD
MRPMRDVRRAVPLLAAALVLLLPAIASAATGCGPDDTFAAAQERGWIWVALGAFSAGFATSLTPCVYPMIPITLAIFGARGGNVSKGRALALATAYVVGMGVTYSILGVTFALIGRTGGFGSQLSNPWVVFPLAALFLALALSMFGVFDLNLPASWQARLNQVGGKGFGGAFAMGLVGGLIAAPCTGPFLFGLLTYVSTTGSVVSGGALLFVYALGMGVLFWVLAAVSRALPKSGAWMDMVKSIGGVALLFAAIYYVKGFIPGLKDIASPETWFLVVSLLLAVGGVLAGAFHLSFHGQRKEKLRKGFGVALVLIGALGAWTWWLTPKKHLPWLHDEATAFALAKTQHKGVMIDFTADWCGACHEMEKTFGDNEVYDTIVDNFIPLQLDVSGGNDADDALRERFHATGTMPAIAFWTGERDRTFIRNVEGMKEPDEFLTDVACAVKLLRARGSQSASR